MWRLRSWGSAAFIMLIPCLLLTVFYQTWTWTFITIFYMTLLALQLAGFLWQSRKINVQQRIVRSDVMLNEPLEVEIVLHLKRVGMMWFGLRTGEHRRMFLPGQTKQIRYRYMINNQTASRGKYMLPPVVIESGDALDWFGMKREFHDQDEFWVYPLPELPDVYRSYWLRKDRMFTGKHNRKRLSRAGDLRPFRPEDAFRYVDWKASARSEQLYVRERPDLETDENWIVVPDVGWDQDISGESQEKVIAIAAALMTDISRGLPGLLIADRQNARILLPGHGSSTDRMRQLAEWDVSEVMNLADVLSRLAHIHDVRHRLLVITPRLSPACVHVLEAYEPGMVWQLSSSKDDLRRLQHRGWVTIGPDDKVVDSHAN